MEPAMTATLWSADSALPLSMSPGRLSIWRTWQPKRLPYNLGLMITSRTSRKARRLRQKTIKRIAKQSLVGTTATALAEERLAALDELQRLMKERRIDFDKWLRTIREGRR
jgi:hypothetical protein